MYRGDTNHLTREYLSYQFTYWSTEISLQQFVVTDRESELFLDENPSRSTLPKYYCNNSNILCFVSMIKILLLKLKKKFINPLSLKMYCNNFYLLWLISMLKAQEKIDLFIFESYIFVISLVSIIILFSWSGKL